MTWGNCFVSFENAGTNVILYFEVIVIVADSFILSLVIELGDAGDLGKRPGSFKIIRYLFSRFVYQ